MTTDDAPNLGCWAEVFEWTGERRLPNEEWYIDGDTFGRPYRVGPGYQTNVPPNRHFILRLRVHRDPQTGAEIDAEIARLVARKDSDRQVMRSGTLIGRFEDNGSLIFRSDVTFRAFGAADLNAIFAARKRLFPEAGA